MPSLPNPIPNPMVTHRGDPRTLAFLFLLLALSVVFVDTAVAGVGGAEFNDIYTKLVGWAQGTPGRIVMFLGFVVAAVSAVVAQSIAGFVVGLGIGLGVYYANNLVEGVVTATLPLADATLQLPPLAEATTRLLL
jgi:conjugal transfer pilus assembly protein TraA